MDGFYVEVGQLGFRGRPDGRGHAGDEPLVAGENGGLGFRVQRADFASRAISLVDVSNRETNDTYPLFRCRQGHRPR